MEAAGDHRTMRVATAGRQAPTPRRVPVCGTNGRLSPGPLGPPAERRPALPRYDRYAWDKGAGGVLEDQRVNPVCALQQQRVLIVLLQCAGQLDAADQVDRNRLVHRNPPFPNRRPTLKQSTTCLTCHQPAASLSKDGMVLSSPDSRSGWKEIPSALTYALTRPRPHGEPCGPGIVAERCPPPARAHTEKPEKPNDLGGAGRVERKVRHGYQTTNHRKTEA